MFLSTLLTSLPLDFEGAVRQVASLGFPSVDVVARSERPQSHLEALADTELVVACAALGKGLPADRTLDAEDIGSRRATVEEIKRQIADGARLGATHGYLVPGHDASPAGLARFADASTLLADFAGQRMVRLCVEHVPGRSLGTAAATLRWLETIGHPNLALLVDVGHCLISGEDPADVIPLAGRRLGWVHLDDNDGNSDLHWPLLTGRLTEEMLRTTLAALRSAGYAGGLTLELQAENAKPVDALREGKRLLERLLAEVG